MVSETRSGFACRVQAKLLLCGEHIALCGGGAAGLPVPESLHLHFTKHEGALVCTSRITAPCGSVSELPVPHAFFAFVRRVCAHHALPLLGETLTGTLNIESSIPLGSGLGSSAALCCAIARLVLHYAQAKHVQKKQAQQERRVWYLAHEFEQFFHARASGIDTALCAFARPLVLEPARLSDTLPQFQPVPIARKVLDKLHVVYGFMPREAACSTSIAAVQGHVNTPQKAQAFIEETAMVLKLLQSTSAHELCSNLAPHLTRIHQHLVRVGVSTQTMEKVIAYAQTQGACAAKISGAGAGGALVCLCASEENARHLARMLMHTFAASAELQAYMLPHGGAAPTPPFE